MKLAALTVVAAILCEGCAGPAVPQYRTDPTPTAGEVADMLLRQSKQRLEDRQREQQLDQQEAAYDRQKCLQVGYRGPDLEQCVRDSAAWRRGVRPGSPQPARSPGIDCITTGDSDMAITTCD